MAVDFSKFADVLKSLGVAGEVRELPEPAPTAAAAAQQLGCEVGAIANSLVFDADGAPNEPGIQWKVGQVVRELTHFSRGGI